MSSLDNALDQIICVFQCFVKLNGDPAGQNLFDRAHVFPNKQDLSKDTMVNAALMLLENHTDTYKADDFDPERTRVQFYEHGVWQDLGKSEQFPGGQFVRILFTEKEVTPLHPSFITNSSLGETLDTSNSHDQKPPVRSSTPVETEPVLQKTDDYSSDDQFTAKELQYMFEKSEAIDVKELLKQWGNGKPGGIAKRILKDFKAAHIIGKREHKNLRNSLERLLLNYYMAKSENKELTGVERAKIAFSIVEAYPFLRSTNGKFPYDSIMCPFSGAGSLNNKYYLKRSRDHLTTCRSYDKSTKADKVMADIYEEEISPDVLVKYKETMRNLDPSTEGNRNEVGRLMEITFNERHCKWVLKEQPTITQILIEYPAFRCQISLITEEARRVFDLYFEICKCSNFSERFEEFAYYIVKQAFDPHKMVQTQKNLFYDFGIDTIEPIGQLDKEELCILAVYCLPYLVSNWKTSTISIKEGKKIVHINCADVSSHLIRFQKKAIHPRHLNDLVEVFADNDPTLTQPYLLALNDTGLPQTADLTKVPEYHLVVDKQVIPLYGYRMSEAIATLFCSYFAFGVIYSQRTKAVMHVMEQMFGLIPKKKFSRDLNIQPVARSAYQCLIVEMTTDNEPNSMETDEQNENSEENTANLSTEFY